MAKPAGEWHENEPLSASKLNANDSLNLREIRVAGRGLSAVRTGQSVTLRLDPAASPVHIVRGHVTQLRGANDHPLLAGVTPWNGTQDIGPQLWVRMIEPVTDLPGPCDDANVFIVRPYWRTGILDPDQREVQWAQVLPDPADQLGIVVCRGPCGENDFPDSRYHVMFAKVGNVGGDKNAKVIIVPDLTYEPPDCKGAYMTSGCFHPKVITATHLHEYDCDTHLVRAGTPVVLKSYADAGFPPVRRWLFQIADLSTCYPPCPPPSYCCPCYQLQYTADPDVPPVQMYQTGAKFWVSGDGTYFVSFEAGQWLLTFADGTKYTAPGTTPCPPTDPAAWTLVPASGSGVILAFECCPSSSSSSSSSSGPCPDCYEVKYTADPSTDPIILNNAGENSWTSDDDASYISGDGEGNWTLTFTNEGGVDTAVYIASGPCPPTDVGAWTKQSGIPVLFSIGPCSSSSSSASSSSASSSSGSSSSSGCDCGPIPCPPAGDGTYILSATMSGGHCTYQWLSTAVCGSSAR